LAFILLIDDDVEMIQRIQPILAHEGYQVSHAVPGPLAFRTALLEEPDLVILGIRSQEREWQFFRRLISVLDSPLFLLLSNANELDRVKGLDLGADDCMVRPASLVELVARVRALLRRDNSVPSWRKRSYFVDGDLVVDLTKRSVLLNNRQVALTTIEFRILSCLVGNVGAVVPHERLSAQVWGAGYLESNDLIRAHIFQLRQKLEADPSHPQRIVTRRGEGYMLQRIAAA